LNKKTAEPRNPWQQICRGRPEVARRRNKSTITTIVGQNKKLSYHACRGWRPRQPARSDEVWIYHKVMQMYKDVRGGRTSDFCKAEIAPLGHSLLHRNIILFQIQLTIFC